MALSGVHIAYRYATTIAGVSSTLPGDLISSQYMTLGNFPNGTLATVISPGDNVLLSISSSIPIFYARGKNPDPTGVTGPNEYMDPLNGREDIYVKNGAKFAWVPA